MIFSITGGLCHVDVETTISPPSLSHRTIFRVHVGPFNSSITSIEPNTATPREHRDYGLSSRSSSCLKLKEVSWASSIQRAHRFASSGMPTGWMPRRIHSLIPMASSGTQAMPRAPFLRQYLISGTNTVPYSIQTSMIGSSRHTLMSNSSTRDMVTILYGFEIRTFLNEGIFHLSKDSGC